MNRWIAVLAAATTLTGSSEARGQNYVRADCRPFLSAAAPTQSRTQEGWYWRFWTGECADLVFCISGSPNWNDIVEKLAARASPTQAAKVHVKACALGQLIGLEWSREKRARRINTVDLRRFKAKLDAVPNVLEGLEQIEASARAKINAPPGAGAAS